MKPTITAFLVTCLLFACTPENNPGYQDGWLDAELPQDTAGDDAGCASTAPYCSADHTRVVTCNPVTLAETTVETCGTGEGCVGGACVTVACIPGTFECEDETTQRICREDGSGWDSNYCGDEMRCYPDDGRCGEICMIRLFILVDQSGSMSDGTPSKWQQARTAIQTIMTSPTAEDVQFGFGAFPSDGDCAADDIVIYPVPDATPTNVDSYFGDGPYGNTPLTFALEFFQTDSTANLRNTSYHNAILVISDGMDSCYIDCIERCGMNMGCLFSCEAEVEPLAAAQLSMITANLRDAHQIRTFVVGFGSDVSAVELNAIASNGGTYQTEYIQASNVSELEAAFQDILDEMWQCNDIII